MSTVYYDYGDNRLFLFVADQRFRGLLHSESSVTIIGSNSHEIFMKTGGLFTVVMVLLTSPPLIIPVLPFLAIFVTGVF